MEQAIPISGISWLVTGLVALTAGFKVRQSSRQHPEDGALRSFMWFFIFIGLFLLSLALPHIALLSSNSSSLFRFLMTWFSHDGPPHMFLYISFAFIASTPFQLYYPKLRKPVFVFLILVGFSILVFTMINVPYYPTKFDPVSGVTFPNHHPVQEKIIDPMYSRVSFLPAILIFLFKGLPSPKRVVKIRSILFVLGMVALAIAGPLNAAADTSMEVIRANIFSLAGFLLLATGVFYRVEEVKEEKEGKI